MEQETAPASRRMTRAEREDAVLDAAAALFYPRGVHEVGMDELVRATGLGKATVYRLFPTKDELIGAYLERLATGVLSLVDAEIEARPHDPRGALMAVLDAVEADIARPGFRGCAFNNASVEYDDRDHPARVQARRYRQSLYRRLTELALELDADRGGALGGELAVLIDGAYTSSAHLGADGPAADGLRLARRLVAAAGEGR